MFDTAFFEGNARQYSSVIVAVDDDDLAERIQSYFVEQGSQTVTAVEMPARLLEHPAPSGDTVVVMGLSVIRRLAKIDADALAALCDRTHVLLLLRSEEFLDSTDFLESVDGVVFEDATLHRLPEAAVLAAAGYSVLPMRAMADIFTDRLRCETVSGLPAVELAILERMRRGDGNRAIARCLAMREASVKTKVRSILRGLKLKNRTEAAVFAARQHGLIHQTMGHRLGEAGALSLAEERMPVLMS